MFEEYNTLVSIEDLCQMLDIGKNSAYDLLKHKQLKSFRIGKKYKIPKQSVEEYVREKARLK